MRAIPWLLLSAGCEGEGTTKDDTGSPTDTGETPDTGTLTDTATTLPSGDRAVRVELDRIEAEGPDPIVVRVIVQRDGAPDEPGALEVTIAGEAVTADLVEPGVYEAQAVPGGERIEVPITVTVDGIAAPPRTALVLPVVDACWGQPESVPGLVNTPAYEDSTEIDPSGEWLIVSNYSPLDLISCFSVLPFPPPTEPACNTLTGPYGPPERPDFFGAERILSPTAIDHSIPSMGLVGEDGGAFEVALPPVTAYGFRRQADGTFGEPFVIGLDASGYPNAPFGINFAAPLQGDTAELVYAWHDPTSGSPDADLHRSTVTLGAKSVLSVLEGPPGGWTLTPPIPTLDLADPSGLQSNPFVAADGVFFDQHDPTQEESDLWFVEGDWRSSLGTPQRVGVSQEGREEFQPYESQGRLYYATGAFETLRSAQRLAGSPAEASSFGPERIEIDLDGPIPVPETAVSLGEPSVAIRDGRRELYFVYGMIREDGLDSQVGRVLARPDCD